MTTYDVVTLGETMLRLTPPAFKRIEQTDIFEIEVGGSESNLAVGLVRLGLRAAWLSRLPASPLGRRVANTLRGYGVDTRYVAWAEDDRLGLYFLEEGAPPRGTTVLYDRRDSAMSRMRPEELPLDLFQAGRSRLLHLSGITPALGPAAAATCRRALELAKEAGWRVSFDLNYRSKLWTPAEAAAGCAPFAAAADLLLLPWSDVQLVYAIDPLTPVEEILEQLAGRFPQTAIVMTLGAEGAAGRSAGAGTPVVRQPAPHAEPIGRIGGGDAFAAGFLFGYLTAEADALSAGLRWGTAAAAVKYTVPGDIPLIDARDVAALVEGTQELRSVRR